MSVQPTKFRQWRQMAAEKFKGAPKTEFPAEFIELEHKLEEVKLMYDSLPRSVKTYLQPNPAVNMQNAFIDAIGKLKEDSRLGVTSREHAETALAALAQCFSRNGVVMGDTNTALGSVLTRTGDAYESLNTAFKEFESESHRQFITPLHQYAKENIETALQTTKGAHQARLELDTLKSVAKRRSDEKSKEALAAKLDEAQCAFETQVIQAVNEMRLVIRATDVQKCVVDFVRAQTLLFERAHGIFQIALQELESIRPISDSPFQL